MLRPLYDWVLRMAAGRYALAVLAAVATVEATFPFAPPDVMLAPMVLARRERAWLYAGVCTLFSVLGGCIGYALGYFASDLVVHFMAAIGRAAAMNAVQAQYAQIGLAVILIKGLTPVPYMVVTLASGLFRFSFPVFVAASLATRGGRFFMVAALMQHPHAKAFVDRYFAWLAVAGVALIVLAFVLLHLLETHAR
jgi:membrane protein YqaA with SNARE-associated domain